MSCTLGVDIGTFESKGVLVSHSGRIIGSASRPHELIVPRAGWAEHRAEEDWWGDFVHITRTLLDSTGINPGQVDAIATSAIGPCMLPVDGNGHPLMNGVLYGVDTRASREIDLLNREIGEDRILDLCGNALTSQSVGPKILWLRRQEPEIFRRTARVLTSTSYLVSRLTGNDVIDHYTAASFSPLYDIDQRCWTTDLTDDIISPERLPKLAWSTEIAGHVNARAAQETGLAAGTPVTTGTIDAAAEAVSVGTRHEGDMMMMYGSTIFIIQIAAERFRNDRLWHAPWLYPGTHATMAGLATSGTLTHWFRDQLARDLDRDEAFAALAEEAEASPPGANGLIILPYFSGERTPLHDPMAKGSVFGLNLTHSRGDIYRALLEGIANGTAHVIDTYREAGHPPVRILAVGGGVRNQVWLQATSDIGQVPQIIAEKTVGASYGNAFLAACAAGIAEPDDIDAWNPEAGRISPRQLPVHARQYRLFRRLYEQTRDIAAELHEAR